jgi:hypothetical protein
LEWVINIIFNFNKCTNELNFLLEEEKAIIGPGKFWPSHNVEKIGPAKIWPSQLLAQPKFRKYWPTQILAGPILAAGPVLGFSSTLNKCIFNCHRLK